jgi:dinuclear metal center YbgI/SA1388 family protein
MLIKCQSICEVIEQWAPKYLAEEWDNVGLQVGDPQQHVKQLLVALNVTSDTIKQAKEVGAQMIVAHHPLIFRPLKKICADSVVGSIVIEAIRNGIAIYTAHTNLDSAKHGINDLLATKLGLDTTEILSSTYQEKLVKIVVFVPAGYEDAVRNAMAEAGAGWIGNYSYCSFQSKGSGTFLPRAGANPFIGTQGTVEEVEEYRLETIARESEVKRIVAAMRKAHPYEEVAYDAYALENDGEHVGLGRIGKLPQPIPVTDLIAKVKGYLGCGYVRIVGDQDRMVNKIAVCGGSGAGFIGKAIAMGADVLITGDVKYHEAQEAVAQGLILLDAGHFATEQIVVPVLAQYVMDHAQKQAWELEVHTASEEDVFQIF